MATNLAGSVQDNLVEHLRSLHIGSPPRSPDRDAYVTQQVIEQAFEALAAEFPLVEEAYRDTFTMKYIPGIWRSIKNDMVKALCQPYRTAISEKNSEIAGLHQDAATKNSEISGLLSEITKKDSEISQLRQDLTQLALDHSSKINTNVEKIATLKARVSELQKSSDYYGSEALRLTTENLHLRSQQIPPTGVPATGTRTLTWEAVLLDRNNSLDEDLPRIHDIISDKKVDDLAATTFTREPEMYKRVQKCFHAQLKSTMNDNHPGSQVFDTHNTEVIMGFKPDISVVTESRTTPSADGLIAIVELKVGKLSKEAFGQLYDYLKGIQTLHPNRRFIIGLLSNLMENQFVMLVNSNRRTRCLRYKSVGLQVALTYLRDVVIADSMYHPPSSVFVPALGQMEGQLGNPAFSIVGVFKVHRRMKSPKFREGRWVNSSFKFPYGSQMVVKRTTPGVHGTAYLSRAPRTVENEIDILLNIAGKPRDPVMEGWKYLPSILYHTLDYQEFGILPRGVPLHASDGHTNWQKVLSDVLDALMWLHSHNIIHRDVRLDNIIWNVDHAVLIDLGTAVDTSDGTLVNFNGGYVCCPPKLLGDMQCIYLPTPADDCLSVVLLVNSILFPSRWDSFRSEKLEMAGSPETMQMEKFWARMQTSQIWEPFFDAASRAYYGGLRRMDQFFVHMQPVM